MRAFQIDKDRPMAYLQITTDTAAAATTTKVTKYDPATKKKCPEVDLGISPPRDHEAKI